MILFLWLFSFLCYASPPPPPFVEVAVEEEEDDDVVVVVVAVGVAAGVENLLLLATGSTKVFSGCLYSHATR